MMPWLLRGEQVLAALEPAAGVGRGARLVLGQEDVQGAYLVRRARAIHALGVRQAMDVALCAPAAPDPDGPPGPPGTERFMVVRVCTLAPGRVGRPCLRPRCVIGARAGAFERWSLRPGDALEVRA
ncbi:MAG: DUF192 domain-containing protein [Acidimicrobiales bacterium]